MESPVTEKKSSSDGIARLETLETRAAIADLVHGYANNVRAGNTADCVKLFTADGSFEVREDFFGGPDGGRTRSKVVGHADIAAYLNRTAVAKIRVCPLIHNLVVRIDGLRATSNCAMMSIIWPSGQKIVGEYHDSYRYEHGWRFSSRIFTIIGEFGPDPTATQHN